MKASKRDKIFDDNQEDILKHFDLSSVRRINEEPKRVNIDFPTWMVQSLDKEARHLVQEGGNSQTILKAKRFFQKIGFLNSFRERSTQSVEECVPKQSLGTSKILTFQISPLKKPLFSVSF